MLHLLRKHGFFAMVALLVAAVIVPYFNAMPSMTDAFYHYNVATRLATGEGFVDDVLWTYVGAPDYLPTPSHLYWMPLTSVIAAAGMVLFGISYSAAQLGLVLCLWGGALVAYWLGWRFGASARHAWIAGAIVLFGGFFMRFWGATDTFSPYLFIGSSALVFIGLGAQAVQVKIRRGWVIWLLAGVFAALGHLTRSDGLLLLLVGWWVLIWPRPRRHVRLLLVFSAAYLLTMAPWFLRNLAEVGTPLPTGGTQAIWYTSYNDLFNYPPDANPQTFFADGLNLLLSSRADAFVQNLGTFVAVEGLIIMTPLMLLGLWRRRREAFWRGMWLFAIGVHLAFTLVFPFPGIRGGLFHAVAALMPFWAVLALLGLDDVVDWIASKRHNWRPRIAKWLFSLGLLATVTIMSLQVALPRRQFASTPPLYPALAQILPSDARVMINDPGILYYYTGLGGVTLPNEAPAVIPQIAATYAIDYLVVEFSRSGGVAMPAPLIFDFDNPPPFLVPIGELNRRDARLYAIER